VDQDLLFKSVSKLLGKAIEDFAKSLSKELSKFSEMEIMESEEGLQTVEPLEYSVEQASPVDIGDNEFVSQAMAEEYESTATDPVAIQESDTPFVADTMELPGPTSTPAVSMDLSIPSSGIDSSMELLPEETTPIDSEPAPEPSFQAASQIQAVPAVEPSPIPSLEAEQITATGTAPTPSPLNPVDTPRPATIDVRQADIRVETANMPERGFSAEGTLDDFINESANFQSVGRDTISLMMDHQKTAHDWGSRSSEKQLELYNRMARDLANDYWRLDGLTNAYERGRSTITDTNV
jgi:hypothetical protein